MRFSSIVMCGLVSSLSFAQSAQSDDSFVEKLETGISIDKEAFLTIKPEVENQTYAQSEKYLTLKAKVWYVSNVELSSGSIVYVNAAGKEAKATFNFEKSEFKDTFAYSTAELLTISQLKTFVVHACSKSQSVGTCWKETSDGTLTVEGRLNRTGEVEVTPFSLVTRYSVTEATTEIASTGTVTGNQCNCAKCTMQRNGGQSTNASGQSDLQAWAEEEAAMMADRGTCGHVRGAPKRGYRTFVGVGCGMTCTPSGDGWTLVGNATNNGKWVRVWANYTSN